MLHTWRKTLAHLSRDAVGYRCFAVLVVLLSLRSMTTCQSDKRGCRHQLLRRCCSMNRWAFGNRTAEQFDPTGSTGWLFATYWLHISYLLAAYLLLIGCILATYWPIAIDLKRCQTKGCHGMGGISWLWRLCATQMQRSLQTHGPTALVRCGVGKI